MYLKRFHFGNNLAYAAVGGRDQHGSPALNRVLADLINVDTQQLDKLTEKQWEDAFRAGGYSQPLAGRFIRRLKQKIAEGLALEE
jgi:hypothetical protein